MVLLFDNIAFVVIVVFVYLADKNLSKPAEQGLFTLASHLTLTPQKRLF